MPSHRAQHPDCTCSDKRIAEEEEANALQRVDDFGSTSLVLEAIHMFLTALRLIYVPFRSKSGTCPATQRLLPGYGAKRHPDGQRDDGLTRNGRLTARREWIF